MILQNDMPAFCFLEVQKCVGKWRLKFGLIIFFLTFYAIRVLSRMLSEHRFSKMYFWIRMIHIWRPWKFSNFQDPSLILPIYIQNFFPPWLWTSNFKRNPSHTVHVSKLNQNKDKTKPHYFDIDHTFSFSI